MKNESLIKNFIKNGYCKVKLYKKSEIDKIKKIIIKKLKSLDKKKFLKDLDLNNLHNYHLLNLNEEYHKNILKTSTRYIKLNNHLNLLLKKFQILNLIMKKCWGHNNSILYWVGSLKKRNFKSNVIGFRISRPNKIRKRDATGVHIDLHVGGKICSDKNVLITLWIPIIGFSPKYSLRIAPGSHLVDHPVKSFIKSKTVTNIFSENYTKKFKFVRPNLKIGEVIIFHPNLLHGNSLNKGNKSRLSLEARLYNKNNIKIWKQV